MTTKKITIHRALTELKTIGDRIDKKMMDLNVVGIKKGEKVDIHHTPEEFEERAKAELKSLSDLMGRRATIKNAIVRSNVETVVNVGDLTFTVASAIIHKTFMKSEEILCKKLKNMYDGVKLNVEKSLVKVEGNALTMGMNLDAKASNDRNSNNEDVNAVMDQYKKLNSLELFDPMDVMTLYKRYDDVNIEFALNIDAALSESNAITTIEV